MQHTQSVSGNSVRPNLPHQHTLALQLQILDAQFVKGHFDDDSDANRIVSNKLVDNFSVCANKQCDLTHSCAAMSAQGHKRVIEIRVVNVSQCMPQEHKLEINSHTKASLSKQYIVKYELLASSTSLSF